MTHLSGHLGDQGALGKTWHLTKKKGRRCARCRPDGLNQIHQGYEDLGIWRWWRWWDLGITFVWRLCRTTLFGRCWTHAHLRSNWPKQLQPVAGAVSELEELPCYRVSTALFQAPKSHPQSPEHRSLRGQAGGFTGTAGAFHSGGAGDHRQWSGCSHRWQGAVWHVSHAAAVQGWCVCFLFKEKRPLKLRLGRWMKMMFLLDMFGNGQGLVNVPWLGNIGHHQK